MMTWLNPEKETSFNEKGSQKKADKIQDRPSV